MVDKQWGISSLKTEGNRDSGLTCKDNKNIEVNLCCINNIFFN